MGILGWLLSQCFSRYVRHRLNPSLANCFLQHLPARLTEMSTIPAVHGTPTVLKRVYVPQDVIKEPLLMPRCTKRVPIVMLAIEHMQCRWQP